MVTQKLDPSPEKSIWDQMRSPASGGGSPGRPSLPRLMVWLVLFVSVTYLVYALRLVSTSRPCPEEDPFSTARRLSSTTSFSSSTDTQTRNRTEARREPEEALQRTELKHIVFGIAASAKLWDQRKSYIKLWWFVMGDDDTVFVTENLLRVLNKYDHRQFYYIGSLSESHLQNIYFSYGMAYGGGGFAISYPLAKALSEMQDSCIRRYPGLYGSDDRIQACMAELGVPLTKELGFHQ
ncbi:hypothetical protein CRG98_033408, partial [Punica granatum]